MTTPLSFRPGPQRLELLGRALAFGLTIGLAWTSAEAQQVDCGVLRAEIDAATNGTDDEAATLLQDRTRELRRAQTYLDSLGCEGSDLPFSDAPAECQGIETRVARLRASVERLQAQAGTQPGDSDSRRRALVERYNAACTAESGPAAEPETGPADSDNPTPPDEAKAPAGDVKALCVRACDGGYFPITDRTPGSDVRLKDLGTLCTALCPGTAAILYTAAPSGSIETAVASDGSPYSALPTAFKFQKSYDATCSCKPPHQSWADALANAEKLIETDKADVTVTQRMSDDMSRPNPARPGQQKGSGKAAGRDPKTSPSAGKPSPSTKRKPSTGGGTLADQTSAVPPPAGDVGQDIMQQLRRDAPAL